ncbi:nucleotidyltransferase family protein [Paraglaciecola aquimarina]|uniref:Nucleotidyltransferase family protein n=1 Tax=Paraglaciecola algarum TaxID=3050085 RepID=A0ABS9DDQ5_9ALTE|nr:nucleotidyltransferase family protein [Paraglaciecola sp. G1-23]MCF2949884.1 nucleotidyltransferase family protein [Paraglaciecola sp. G1-23]
MTNDVKPQTLDQEEIETLLAKLLLSPDIEWINEVTNKYSAAVLLEQAIKHGVAAVLYQAWLKFDEKSQQISCIDLFKNIDNKLKLMHGFLQPVTDQVFNAFRQHNIAFVMLKGYALSHSVYSLPHIRPRTDIDILIDEKDSDRLRALLESLGFNNPRGWQPKVIIDQFSFNKEIANGIKLSLDVHLKISNDKSLQEVITFDELMHDGSRHLKNTGQLISKPYGLIHAVFHLLHHQKHGDFIKLVWYYDIKLLLENMTKSEYQTLKTLITEKKCGAVVNAVLAKVDALFTVEKIKALSTDLANVESSPKFDHLLTRPSILLVTWHNFTLVKGVAGKFLFILETFFPPKEEIYVKYGRASKWPLPLLYMRRIFGGIRRFLLK